MFIELTYILLFYVFESRSMLDLEDPSLTTVEGSAVEKNEKFFSGELIFEDTFEKFDTTVWLREPSNAAHVHEFQLFCDSEENSYTQDGILHIKPTFVNESTFPENMQKTGYLRDSFHPIRSARLSTKESFSFAYGVVEFRAKIPSGDWLFPALWLMPKDSDYGPWPLSGEIDIMESRGNRNLTDRSGNLKGAQSVSSTLHWGLNRSLDKWNLTHFEKVNKSCYSSGFHLYSLLWTPDYISFYVDGEQNGIIKPPKGGFWEIGNFTNDNVTDPWAEKEVSTLAPFDHQFYFIINLAVGGTSFFSEYYINEGGKPWNNSSPNAATEFWEGRDQWLPTWNLPSEDSHFLIDYVRVWAL